MSSNWRKGSNSNRGNWQNANQRKRKRCLEPGLTGFLCTCDGKFREKECVRDSYNLLNEFADILFGPDQWRVQAEKVENEAGDDIDASMKEELATLKEEKNAAPGERRFQVLESGVNGKIFVKTTITDPCKLAHSIVSSISETKVQKSKFILRLIPVEATCKVNLDEINKTAAVLFAKYFKDEGKTFSIVFSHKNNEQVSREKITESLASQIINLSDSNKVDLKNPQLAVVVEVIRSVCCIAVVPDYYALKKYNILELCSSENKPDTTENLNVEKTSTVDEQITSKEESAPSLLTP